jgi:hypothetical protein
MIPMDVRWLLESTGANGRPGSLDYPISAEAAFSGIRSGQL